MKLKDIIVEETPNANIKTINNKTIVIDGRKLTQNQIRSIARKHFNLKNEKIGGGTFLGGNLIKYYNVASVADGIVVASLDKLTPSDTKPIATKFLSSIK